MRNVAFALLALLACPVVPSGAHGAAPQEGMVDVPCPAPLVMPPAARSLLVGLFIEPSTLRAEDFLALSAHPAFAPYERELRQRAANDWAGLCRHHHANLETAPGAARVVFIGDSITENWALADPAFFTGGRVNRGIGAQTSAQMLVRFRSDVVRLRPAVVHLLAGTNDVAGNQGPVSPRDFQDNVESMVDIARASGIRVVLGSIPPAASFPWRPAMQPAPRIAELNRWLRDYARERGLGFVDYHVALATPDGALDPSLGNDGVHPNRDGYAVMRRLAERALETFAPEVNP
jgi:lysophospholipase L1-like esterase